MVDWSLQMAAANFSGALMHVGGQGTYYNRELARCSMRPR